MKFLIFILLLLPLSIQAQSNIGIGTTTPVSKLDISASGNGAEILRFSTERPWVFKQRNSGINTRLTLQTTTNDKWFDILSENGLNRTAEFYSNNTFSRVLLVPDGGEVGVGVEDPLAKFQIKHNSSPSNPQLRITEQGYDFNRIKLENDVHTNSFWDIAGLADSTATSARLNFYYSGPQGSGDRMVITGAGSVGIGTGNPGNRLRVNGDANSSQHIISAGVNYSGNVNVRALEGFSTPAVGYGYGGYMVGGNVGVYGTGSGGSHTGNVYGVLGNATGTTGTRIGIYGTATGGSKNWAGFFSAGHVFVTNDLRIGPDAEDGVSGYKVAIDGKIIAEELRVQISSAWPDYVFDETYPLPALDDLDMYIKKHRHLPGVPSAEVVQEEGIEVGDMHRILLKKIEELTLHIIQLNDRIKTLEEK